MSAVKLIPASGGGSVSLAPPNSTSGSDITITLPSTSQTLGGSSGKILQVLQNVKSDTASTSSTSFVDTGLSQAITPSSSSNKILISYDVYMGHTQSEVSFINIVRDSTTIAQPSGSANYPATTHQYIGALVMKQHSMSFLDSPNTTSQITYKLQYRCDSNTIYLNRYSGNDNYHGISNLTLMEVAV